MLEGREWFRKHRQLRNLKAWKSHPPNDEGRKQLLLSSLVRLLQVVQGVQRQLQGAVTCVPVNSPSLGVLKSAQETHCNPELDVDFCFFGLLWVRRLA